MAIKTKSKVGVSKISQKHKIGMINAFKEQGIDLGQPSEPWKDNASYYSVSKLLLNRFCIVDY